jgi:hypothetical protein
VDDMWWVAAKAVSVVLVGTAALLASFEWGRK